MSKELTLAEYVKQLRNKRELTLIQLEEISGVSKSHIAYIESGRIPSAKILFKLEIAFAIPEGSLCIYNFDEDAQRIFWRGIYKNPEFRKKYIKLALGLKPLSSDPGHSKDRAYRLKKSMDFFTNYKAKWEK